MSDTNNGMQHYELMNFCHVSSNLCIITHYGEVFQIFPALPNILLKNINLIIKLESFLNYNINTFHMVIISYILLEAVQQLVDKSS